jgi:hypothetical protein
MGVQDHVFENKEAVATELAKFVVAQSNAAISARGKFLVAFSGFMLAFSRCCTHVLLPFNSLGALLYIA